MSSTSFSSRKFLIAATYVAAAIIFGSFAWQNGAETPSKSNRLSGPETETAFLMQRFGNPQRAEP